MTDISEADEREAREWLRTLADKVTTKPVVSEHARTLLALLDRPRLPKPEEVPEDVLAAMWWQAHGEPLADAKQSQDIYRALYDHYTAPPAPAKVEAREWLAAAEHPLVPKHVDAKHRATLLALLDRPQLPTPEEVPDEVLTKMISKFCVNVVEYDCCYAMRAAYRALCDHYNKPPAPAKVEAWAVVDVTGVRYACVHEEQAKNAANIYGGSIVRLVEADHD